ncbi:MAG TPA: helix-turn-helix domain-containing protein [Clostridia bacterium]|nr:helix-turn-helix domain-containing protein [Clostridia bacterium]
MHYTESLQETILFINENLTADIALKALADRTNFSPYHFHRLFKAFAGEVPMEYVRRHRIISAARDLSADKSTVMEIAFKYRFESQDGFCRAFKKYFGVTPGEYRKLNRRITSSRTSKNGEARLNMFDINVYKDLICSREEKSEVLGTMDKILELSERASKFGLFSLEADINDVQPDFFKKSIQMLVDGVEPEYIRKILLNYAFCSGYKGKELLTRVIILEGITAIQQGVNPVIIREMLSSYFGEDYSEELQKHFGLDAESQQQKIESYLAKIHEKQIYSKETALLEEPLSRLDNRSLQRLLREIDICTLADAISGSGGTIQTRVLRNISIRSAISLIDELENPGTCNILNIVNSQKKILETLVSLRNQGDII